MLGIRCVEGFSIPIGFKFNPTDEEVMKYYLLPAIHQQELPCSFLREFNIYGDKDKEPWKLFGEKGKVDVWVITELKNKSAAKIERTAGCGTWDGQNNNAILDADGKEIGRKKYFNFKCEDASKLKGQWAMHEYSNKHYNYAIVHIQNNEGMKKHMLPNTKHRRQKEIMLGVDCAEGFRIPPGYRFDPTDEEVIKCYLIPSIQQQELPCNILHKLDIYGEETEPWKLFGEQGINGLWVLTQVKNKSKSRIERSVGCGTWNGQNNYPIEDADEKVIGRKRYFKFECKDRSKLKGQWAMHEYALEDYKLNYVICHIENTEDPKKKKRKASSELCEDEHLLWHKRLCSQIASSPEIDQSMMFTNTSNQCYQQESYQYGRNGDGGNLILPILIQNYEQVDYQQENNGDGNGGYVNLEVETQNMSCTAQNNNPNMYCNLEGNTYEGFITNEYANESQLPTATTNHLPQVFITYQGQMWSQDDLFAQVKNQERQSCNEVEKYGKELAELNEFLCNSPISEEQPSCDEFVKQSIGEDWSEAALEKLVNQNYDNLEINTYDSVVCQTSITNQLVAEKQLGADCNEEQERQAYQLACNGLDQILSQLVENYGQQLVDELNELENIWNAQISAEKQRQNTAGEDWSETDLKEFLDQI